jgi:hypothetical protein
MATTLKTKNSVTTTVVPTTLVQGELAVNITDKKMWVGNAASSPVQLFGAGADSNFTNISVSGVATFGAGTVSLPSITTTGDTNTGIYFPAADTIAFTEGGVESMRIDSSGNVGIGTSSPDGKLTIETANSNTPRIRFQNASFDGDAAVSTFVSSTGTDLVLGSNTYINSSGNLARFDSAQAGSYVYAGRTGNLFFGTNDSSGVATERMRIDSDGNLLVGTTTAQAPITATVASAGAMLSLDRTSNIDANLRDMVQFRRSVTSVGSITCSNTLTAYNTTSDYRLKTVIGNVTGAGQRIDALEPIEYDWKNGGRTKGFLAHQFAEVYPNSVSGSKDAVDKEGKPVYQAMQASTPEVMADLIAEIQSLRKRVAQLESK